MSAAESAIYGSVSEDVGQGRDLTTEYDRITCISQIGSALLLGDIELWDELMRTSGLV
jgi:hypothetical protein